VEDGWLMLNGEEYRKKVSEEMRKARLRRAQTNYRQRNKLAIKRNTKTSGEFQEREGRFVEAHNDGEQEKCDSIAAEGL